jgi:hypothetical protein
MKNLILILLFLYLGLDLHAQQKVTTYTITADSVLLTSCDSSELIIQNHTQNVPGFLFNNGNGRTIFKHALQPLGGSSYLLGGDTLDLAANAWVEGGNVWGTNGIIGTLDNYPLDFYTSGHLFARMNNQGNMLIGTATDNGFKLQVNSPGGYGLYATGNAHILGNVGILSGIDGGSLDAEHAIRADPGYTSMIFESAGQGGNVDMFTFSSTGGAYAKPIYNQDESIIKVNAGFSDGNIAGISGNIISLEPIYDATNSNSLTLRGIYYNPILQSMVGARNVAVETVTGDVLIGTTSGNMGIGTSTPTAQLHTTGSVRFAGLTQDSTQTQVLVTDANGNLYYRSASSLAANDPIRSSLAVKGTIKSKKIIISPDEWADYVFDSTYRLPRLEDLESYIHKEHHLPGIPSAATVQKDSLDIGVNQAALLKKIEELTLYSIEQNKKIIQQDKEMGLMKARLEKLEKMIDHKD